MALGVAVLAPHLVMIVMMMEVLKVMMMAMMKVMMMKVMMVMMIMMSCSVRFPPRR